MKITIINKQYKCLPPWSVGGKDLCTSYIRMSFYFKVMAFVVCTPNTITCYRNPLTAISEAFKSICLNSSKYDMLTQKLIENGMWRQL